MRHLHGGDSAAEGRDCGREAIRMQATGDSRHFVGIQAAVQIVCIRFNRLARQIMKCRAAIKYFGVLYLSIALFWYAIGAEIIQAEYSQFDAFMCDNAAMCATSKPSSLFAVRSKIMCTFECQHQREPCIGVNYLAMNNTCELFGDNPTSFSQTVNGCRYMQVTINLCRSHFY